MKKFNFLVPIFFSVICGLLIGKVFFTKYENLTNTINEQMIFYFIEKDVYKDENIAKESYDDENLLSIEEDGLHEYVSITQNKNNAKKIKEIYDSVGNNTYIREKILSKEKIISMIEEYDKLLSSLNTNEEIINLSKSIIKSYKEIENADN